MNSPTVSFPTDGRVKIRYMGNAKNLTPADTEAAARLKAIWGAMPKGVRPTQQQLADQFPGDANQSLISQYINGRIPLNYRAVLFFSKVLGVHESAIRTDLPEQLLNASAVIAPPSQSGGFTEPSIHEALTLLLFDLDHGGPRSTRSATDLFMKLLRRIEACGGRLPEDEQEAFEQKARDRGKAQGDHVASKRKAGRTGN